MQIDESLQFFARNLQPRAIVISGRWGVGKTFYWRERVVKDFFANANLRNVDRGYAYVSLFGIDSIRQLKNSLAYSYAENKPLGGFRYYWSVVKKYFRGLLEMVSRWFVDELSLGKKELGVKVKITSLVDDFAFLSIKGSLVCIDDVERRNKKLSIGDVLGIVSYLVEQRDCRVALILNFDTLEPGEKEEWERSKDKTFEAELLYQPTMEASIEAGMIGTEHEVWHEQVKECLKILRIDNVRVVGRTQRFIRQIISEMKKDSRLTDVPEYFWREIIKVGCLLAAVNASRGVGAPDLDELLSGRTQLHLNDDKDSRVLTKEQKEWRNVVGEYNIYLGDSLDHAIGQSVKDGYPRMDLLVPAALDWNKSMEKSARAEKFREAWNQYHDSFDPDPDRLFARFRDAVKYVIADESVGNISSTGVLFRELGHPEAATELFFAWVEERKDGRQKELDEESFFPGFEVDKEFLEIIRNARSSFTGERKSIDEALVEIDSGAWGKSSITAVSQASPEEIVKVMTSRQRDWRRCIEVLTTYNLHGEEGVRARRHFKEALVLISNMSPLNARRIKGKLNGTRLEEIAVGDAG